MRLALALCALTLLAAPAFGQADGTVAGLVIGPDGGPLAGIHVYLDGTPYGAATARDGRYRLADVPAGGYVLVASGIGYLAQHRPIEVRAEATLTADFRFSAAEILLPEVEVLGRRETAYTSAYTFAATRTAAAPIEVPQVVSTVTKELLDDRQAFTLDEVAKNVGGLHQNTALNDVVVRGFRSHTGPSASGYRLINGLRAGFGYFTSPLLVNVERVEVLKGPGAALYGAVNPGGTINLVTKKPLPEARRAVRFSAGSFNTLRSALDLTGPLTPDGRLLYRVNVGFEHSDTFRDFNGHTTVALAPTVTFVPSDRTTLNAELVYTAFDGFLNRGVAVPAQDLAAADVAQSLAQPSDWYRVQDVYLHASLTHRLAEGLALNLGYLRFSWSENLAEHRTLNRWQDDGTQLVSTMRYWERLDATQTDHLSAFLTLRRATGPLAHTLTTGADYIRFYTDGGTVWEARTRRVPVERQVMDENGQIITITDFVEKPLTFDLRNPVYRHRGNDIATYVFRQNRDVGDREDAYRTLGLYVQDQIALGRRLDVLAGLRLERYRDVLDFELPDDAGPQDQTILIPRLGAVAELGRGVSAYALFARGFTPVSPIFIYRPEQFRPDGQTAAYDHETSRQAEAGLKGSLVGGRLQATLAVFEIIKANVLEKTGEVNGFGNDVLDQLGRVRSRGVEAEVVGQPLAALNLSAHYTYNPTTVVETDDPLQRDAALWGAPTNQAGLWAKYLVPAGHLAGLGAGFGVNYAGERRHRFASTVLGGRDRFYAMWPAYTVADAALYYERDHVKLTLSVNNLFDEKYWIGGFDYLHAYPGAPRHLLVSAGYTF